jgi:alpha-tubulin suppressor-like RCC1 family protein
MEMTHTLEKPRITTGFVHFSLLSSLLITISFLATVLVMVTVSTSPAHAATPVCAKPDGAAAIGANSSSLITYSTTPSSWSGNLQSQTVTSTITAKPNCNVKVTLASYKAAGPTWNTSLPQLLVDYQTVDLAAGQTKTVSVQMPACYYQVDLVFGGVLSGNQLNSNVLYGNKKIKWANGGNTSCYPAPAQAIQPVFECQTLVNSKQKIYEAWFGYNNPNSVTNIIPFGVNNNLNGGTQSGSEAPTGIFLPGRIASQFKVYYKGAVTWKLGSTNLVVNKNSTMCSDTTPVISFNEAPSNPTLATTANFAFSAMMASYYECSLDGAPFQPCANGTFTAPGLALGQHTFTVNAFIPGFKPGTATHTWVVAEQQVFQPTLNLPANITAPATGPGGAQVDYETSATDMFGMILDVICDIPTGSAFPIGETTVNCSATAEIGGTATGSFTINVVDQEPPLITVTSNTVSTNTTSPADLNLPLSAIDNVDGVVSVNCTPDGTALTPGSYSLSCSATDVSGNTASTTVPLTVVLTPDDLNGVSVGATENDPTLLPEDYTQGIDPVDIPNPAPTGVTGNVITNENNDQEYMIRKTSQFGFLKEEIIVHAHQGEKTWAWDLIPGTGAAPVKQADGSVTFGNGNRVAPLRIFNADGERILESMEWDLDGNRLSLTLDDTALALPYTIDPTILYQQVLFPSHFCKGQATLSTCAALGLAPDAEALKGPLGAGASTTTNTRIAYTGTAPLSRGIVSGSTTGSLTAHNLANDSFPVGTKGDAGWLNVGVSGNGTAALPSAQAQLWLAVSSSVVEANVQYRVEARLWRVQRDSNGIITQATPVTDVGSTPLTTGLNGGALKEVGPAVLTAVPSFNDRLFQPGDDLLLLTNLIVESRSVTGNNSVNIRLHSSSGSPRTQIDFAAPPAPPLLTLTPSINGQDATFTWVNNGGAIERTLCSLDGAPFTPCASGITYTGLAGGNHSFTVRAENSNISGTDSTNGLNTYSWMIATAPVNLTPPVVNGSTEAGSVLTLDPGTWSNSPTLTYQWQRCDTTGNNCVDIAGETGLTYTSGPADLGSGIRVAIIAVNAQGSATGYSTVSTAVADTTDPELSTPTTIQETATDSNGKIVNYTVIVDDAGDNSITPVCLPPSGSLFPIGSTLVTCIATDSSGNETVSTFTIDLAAGSPPSIVVSGNTTLEATSPNGASAGFTASGLDYTGATLTALCVPPSGSVFALGSTLVTCQVTDVFNQSATDTLTVTVVDTTAPSLNLPANISVPALGTAADVTYSATAIDVVDGNVPVNCSPVSGSTFSLGVTTVDCSAEDVAGNVVTGSFQVVVSDATAPVLSLPSDIVAEATSSSGATLNYLASALDAVDGPVSVSCLPASGSGFALGTTTVNCLSSDSAGNMSSGSFAVTVEDTTAPELTLPADMTVEATSAAGALVNYVATSADLVDGFTSADCTLAAGSQFALGSTTVVCESTDSSNNTSTGSFSIMVEDTTAPVLTLPADGLTFEAGDVINYSASALDTVDGPVAVSCNVPDGSQLSFTGPFSIDCTTEDSAGNTTSDSFSITLEDTTAPVLTDPYSYTLEATSAAGAETYYEYEVMAIDAVDGYLTVTCDVTAGQTIPLGDTSITCEATDTSGNRGEISFTATVVDTTAPELTVPSVDVEITGIWRPTQTTIVLHGKGFTSPEVQRGTIGFTNGSIDFYRPGGPLESYNAGNGLTNIVWNDTEISFSSIYMPTGMALGGIVANVNGNPALSSYSPVTVGTAPAAPPVLSAVTVEATSAAGATINYTASAVDLVDGPTTVDCIPASGTTFAIGTVNVSCSSSDAAGNSGSKSFEVTVKDTTAPVLTIPNNITVGADDSNGATVTYTATAIDSVDGALNPICTPSSGSLFAIGTTTVNCTVEDSNGNTDSGSFTVFVDNSVSVMSVSSPAPDTIQITGTGLLQMDYFSITGGASATGTEASKTIYRPGYAANASGSFTDWTNTVITYRYGLTPTGTNISTLYPQVGGWNYSQVSLYDVQNSANNIPNYDFTDFIPVSGGSTRVTGIVATGPEEITISGIGLDKMSQLELYYNRPAGSPFAGAPIVLNGLGGNVYYWNASPTEIIARVQGLDGSKVFSVAQYRYLNDAFIQNNAAVTLLPTFVVTDRSDMLISSITKGPTPYSVRITGQELTKLYRFRTYLRDLNGINGNYTSTYFTPTGPETVSWSNSEIIVDSQTLFEGKQIRFFQEAVVDGNLTPISAPSGQTSTLVYGYAPTITSLASPAPGRIRFEGKGFDTGRYAVVEDTNGQKSLLSIAQFQAELGDNCCRTSSTYHISRESTTSAQTSYLLSTHFSELSLPALGGRTIQTVTLYDGTPAGTSYPRVTCTGSSCTTTNTNIGQVVHTYTVPNGGLEVAALPSWFPNGTNYDHNNFFGSNNVVNLLPGTSARQYRIVRSSLGTTRGVDLSTLSQIRMNLNRITDLTTNNSNGILLSAYIQQGDPRGVNDGVNIISVSSSEIVIELETIANGGQIDPTWTGFYVATTMQAWVHETWMGLKQMGNYSGGRWQGVFLPGVNVDPDVSIDSVSYDPATNRVITTGSGLLNINSMILTSEETGFGSFFQNTATITGAISLTDTRLESSVNGLGQDGRTINQVAIRYNNSNTYEANAPLTPTYLPAPSSTINTNYGSITSAYSDGPENVTIEGTFPYREQYDNFSGPRMNGMRIRFTDGSTSSFITRTSCGTSPSFSFSNMQPHRFSFSTTKISISNAGFAGKTVKGFNLSYQYCSGTSTFGADSGHDTPNFIIADDTAPPVVTQVENPVGEAIVINGNNLDKLQGIILSTLGNSSIGETVYQGYYGPASSNTQGSDVLSWTDQQIRIKYDTKLGGLMLNDIQFARESEPNLPMIRTYSEQAIVWGQSSANSLALVSYSGSGLALNSSNGRLLPGSGEVIHGQQASDLTSGYLFNCAIVNGAGYCWGYNSSGQYGNGTVNSSAGTSAFRPQPVSTTGALAGLQLESIDAGANSVCAIASDQKVYCWGNNSFGQLGTGNTTSSTIPVAVDTSGALAGVSLTKVEVGSQHACALSVDGDAYCWGRNLEGRLGNGSTASLSGPVAVNYSGTDPLVDISLTSNSTCAINDQGIVYCWGSNGQGHLGNGSTSDSSIPVAVDMSGALAGKKAMKISSSGGMHCVVADDGQAYCWGAGYMGTGIATTQQEFVPVAVDHSGELAGKTLTDIALGETSCVIDTEGKSYCWGNNSAGTIGNGTDTSANSPTATNMSGALAGQTIAHVTQDQGQHRCALTVSGKVYCWGAANSYGMLGVWNTSAFSLGSFYNPVGVAGRPAI